MFESEVLEAVRREALPLTDDNDCDCVMESIGNASIVLLGEATHGTRDFYRLRAEISRRLILEHGFDAIAVEADWPDALRVNRYINPATARTSDRDAERALSDFVRFPRWMWRNAEIMNLVEWLHAHNIRLEDPAQAVGFFGLDLYSLRSSMRAVVDYLSDVDPEAARQARARYACFDHIAEDPQRYGYAAHFGMRKDCEDEVVHQLLAMNAESLRRAAAAGPQADELFYAQQNARVARNAEAYYRTMFSGRHESWNLRDTHMADTLDALCTHLSERKGRPARIVVWAHNSHIGDARATEMGGEGQINLGQLARERFQGVFLLGFTTHHGTVTAASDWDGPSKTKAVRPGLTGSVESLLHQVGLKRFLLRLGPHSGLHELGVNRLLERAIGVLYLPESERLSHYFETDLSAQFDAVLHVDETVALPPLDHSSLIAEPQVAETYPSGM
jgi:erythromycin esterase-like protein